MTVGWYTHVGSEDGYVVDGSGSFVAKQMKTTDNIEGLRVKRAFSTYLLLGYRFYLPYELEMPIQIGMTPWKSRYTQYKGNFAVCCMTVRLERTFNFDVCRLHVFGTLMMNPYHITAENAIVKISERNLTDEDKIQHLNGQIGIGVWF